MLKKIAFTAIGLVLIATPFAASADLITLPAIPPNATVQDLQNLIQQLTQILNQLLALKYPNYSPTNADATFTASPPSGAAPLTVLFSSRQVGNSVITTIDFGDGVTGSMAGSCTTSYPSTCSNSTSHTYASAGTYTAKLYQQPCLSSGSNGSACPQTLVATTNISVTAPATQSCAGYTRVQCGAGTHLVGGQVFGGCQTGGQCVADTPTTQATSNSSAPTCYLSYSPSTVDRTQTLNVNWSGNGTSRSYFLRNTANNRTFGTSTVLVNGVQQDTGFRAFDLGSYVRTDTVTNSVGTATCSATFTVVAGPATPAACPVYQQLQCPTGQHNTNSGNTTDANGCAVPHYSCVVDSTSCFAPADSKTYLNGQSAEYNDWCSHGGMAGLVCGNGTQVCQNGTWVPTYGVWAAPSGGSQGWGSGAGKCFFAGNTTDVTSKDGCINWCSSMYGVQISQLGEGVLPFGGTCVYKDADGSSQTVAFSSNLNSNLANALVAFTAVFKSFFGQ